MNRSVVLDPEARHTGEMAARGQHNYSTRVWLGAALAHVALFALWQGTESREVVALANHASADEQSMSMASVALIELPSDPSQQPGTVLVAMAGASDHLGAESATAYNNATDAPGASVGQRAPGVGGDESFSDRSDTSLRSASTWNTKSPTIMPRSGDLARGTTSAESLERNPKPAYSNRAQERRRAQRGTRQSAEGLRASQGQGGAPGTSGFEWQAADPRFDSAPAAKQQFVSGAISPHRESLRTDQGTLSREQAARGPASESSSAPARSNRKTASAFHLGAPSRGQGTGTGAQGQARGKSNANNGGSGSAAQSGRGQGTALASTRASRSHPYFNEMYRRIDRELRFPKKLALALEQGDLVLSFQLDRRGHLKSLKLKKGSGFAEFDSEALRAFRAAAPFGKVPDALLNSRDRVAVLAPYYFRNPLIR